MKNWPVVSLIACALCGLAVSLLWPGTLVIAAVRFPMAGASVGPWLTGLIADKAPALLSMLQLNLTPVEFGLRSDLLVGTIFPLMMCFTFLYLICHKTK